MHIRVRSWHFAVVLFVGTGILAYVYLHKAKTAQSYQVNHYDITTRPRPPIIAEPTDSDHKVQNPHILQPADLRRDMEKKMSNVSDEIHQSQSQGPDVKLILLTYMRSGSSFTGDMFNHHSQVFYFYEPFWSMDRQFKKGEPALFFHRKPMKFESDNQLPSLEIGTMKAVLSCTFETMYIQPLMLPMSFSNSVAIKPFGNCYNKNPGIMGLVGCLPVLYRACLSSKASVAKTVRLSMERAETLLKDDPKVKVIHLVRDPRGVLKSREKSTNSKTSKTKSSKFCTVVLQHLRDSQRLKKLYPGRVMTARYEDLAQRPLDFGTRLLDFAGLQMDTRLSQYVKSITSSETVFTESQFGTKRMDSGRTESRWRQTANSEFLAIVDKNCAGIYSHMGYRRFASEKQLRNLSLPAYEDFEKVPGLWTL